MLTVDSDRVDSVDSIDSVDSVYSSHPVHNPSCLAGEDERPGIEE